MPDDTASTAQRLRAADRVKDFNHLMDAFNDFDEDKNGSISCAEMRRVLLAVGLKADDIKRLFLEVDADRDGQISFKEFTNFLFAEADEAAAIKKHIYRTQSPKEAMGEFMDALKDIMGEGGTEDATLKQIFETIDSSGNKKINMTEFVAGARSLGIRMDEKMLQQLFATIDSERKKISKRKAPKVKDGWDADFQAAGVKSDKHVKQDAYALAGMPNLEAPETRYTGSDEKLQGKLIHNPNGEYEEVIQRVDPKTGKVEKIRRKVNEGGVPDHLINFNEFMKAFEEATRPSTSP